MREERRGMKMAFLWERRRGERDLSPYVGSRRFFCVYIFMVRENPLFISDRGFHYYIKKLFIIFDITYRRNYTVDAEVHSTWCRSLE